MASTEQLIEHSSTARSAPRAGHPLGRGIRFLLKSGIKASLLVAGRARTSVAEATEGWQRLYAEARTQAGAAAAGPPGAGAAARKHRPRRRAQADGTRGSAKPGGPAPTHTEPHAGAVDGHAARAEKVGRVDLNTASREELMSLPGIGERIADRILQYREAHGSIRGVDELRQAEILPSHTAEALRDGLAA
jgi:competence ComEA-like helix-hairpin-helix protein